MFCKYVLIYYITFFFFFYKKVKKEKKSAAVLLSFMGRLYVCVCSLQSYDGAVLMLLVFRLRRSEATRVGGRRNMPTAAVIAHSVQTQTDVLFKKSLSCHFSLQHPCHKRH